MIRRPPRSPRTDTLFPYTTLFRSLIERTLIETLRRRAGRDWQLDAFVLTIGMLVIMQNLALIFFGTERRGVSDLIEGTFVLGPLLVSYERLMIVGVAAAAGLALRSEERRVGKALFSTCRSRWATVY